MIKITKQVKIEIDGEDIEALSDICEAARCYLMQNTVGNAVFGQFTKEAAAKMRAMMELVFDKTQ